MAPRRFSTAGMHGDGCGRSRRWIALAEAVFLVAGCAVPALAQDGGSGGGAGRYFSDFWLVMFLLQCVVWVGVYNWIGQDSENLGLQSRFWCALTMSVGAVGMLMMLTVSVGFVFTAAAGLFVVFGLYVWKRNKVVSPEQRVLTADHFGYSLRRVAAALRLRRKAGAVVQAGRRDDSTEILLLRKDGTSLEKLAGRRGPGGVSEAVVSVKELVESAVLSRATDIHLEPKEEELQARFRIDGILHNVPSYQKHLAAPMISSVKVLSDMDIAERRKPQDGTFMGKLGSHTLDFRVSTAPSVHGETMVIRILDRDVGLIHLPKLGFEQDHLAATRRIVNYPHGMLIVCGPTGSGKTTTLYAMLSEIDAYQKNIITIEDPIEYRLDNVTQTNTNPKAGVTFASALRSSLRQDPDVIMVGEIRDAETARVALQAAMTGHFVFTTVHANDAITSLFRLLDLGVEPYLISASLSAVVAQRLMRVLCPTCKEAYVPGPDFLEKIGVSSKQEIELFKAVGCEECQGTGYRGRVGVFEMFELNDKIKDLIRTNPSIQLIRAEAHKTGLRILHEDGLKKVLAGTTSVKELIRVTR